MHDYLVEEIRHLKSLPMEAKERTAKMLANIASKQDERGESSNAAALIKAGAINPLVQMLSGGTDGGQIAAATALGHMCVGSSSRQASLAGAGATSALITLLRTGSNKAQMQAAFALAALSEGLSDKGEGLSHVAPFLKGGVIPPLVRLLRQGIDDAKMHSASCIANICAAASSAQDDVARAGAIPQLVAMLTSGKTQSSAANALARLSAGNTANKEAIASEGAVAPLLQLLNGANVAAQCHAATAIAELSEENAEVQQSVAKAGGIFPLLSLLSGRSSWAQASAARALARLSFGNRDNQEAIARMNGVQPLVAMIGSSNDADVQAMAALALAEICRGNQENQFAVADFGALGQLVVLIRNGTEEVKAEVAGALWTLSDGNAANKVSIASSGGIAPLVQLLATGGPRGNEYATFALLALGLGNVDNQSQITSLLVGLLGAGSLQAMSSAAAALWRLVQDNPTSQQEIARAGAAADLITLLKKGEAEAREYALWSLSLSIDEGNQSVVLGEGGVKPLISVLRGDDQTAREQAAAALHLLAKGCRPAQKDIARSGGIMPLINIVDANVGPNESEGAREHAAAAISDLALVDDNRDQIVGVGGIPPLVQLVINGRDVGRQFAASALARLANDSDEFAAQIAEAGAISPLVNLLSGACGDEAQEEAAGALYALAHNASNRLEITEAGGIGPLVQLLGTTNSKARDHAEGALVRLSIENANRVLIIKKLVSMLDDNPFDDVDGSSAQEQAAAALANLAQDSADNRISIVDAGGIKPLLALLQDSSAKAKENAINAITQLAYRSQEIQRRIADAGGVPLIASVMVATCSNSKEMMQSAVLCSLTARAIAQLSEGNRANQIALCDAGVIPALISVLGSPNAEMQANASMALASMARENADIQGAVARTGAIAPLCALIKEGPDEVKDAAAKTIWALAEENAPNKATIAKLGGIEPLVTLLVSGGADATQTDTIGALVSLAGKHPDNRESICKQLVGRMASRIAMLQTAGGAVRVLVCVSMFADDNHSNQLALAKAGAVPNLIMWLSGGFDARNINVDAQREAARALLSLATNNFILQENIAKSGGIQPLIELISKATLDTKEYATRTLWHLAGNSEVGVIIAQAGGLTPLVEMLSNDDTHLQELAVVVVGRLSRSNPNVSLAVAQAGGVSPLVSLLEKGSTAAQQQAAAALAEVGLAPANRDAIAEAGGIPMLVALMASKVSGTPETAARALAHLARDARDTPDDGGALPDPSPAGVIIADAEGDSKPRGHIDSKEVPSVKKPGTVDRVRLSGHGKMRIVIKRAVKLDSAGDSNGLADPYVTIHGAGQVLRTTVKKATLSPVWDEEFEMLGALNEFVSAGLTLCVFDSDDVTEDDPMAKDDPMGECHVPLDALRFEDSQSFEQQLSTQGKLHLSVRWEAVAGKPGEKRRQAIAKAGGVTRVIEMLQATPLKTTSSKMWQLIAGVIGLKESSMTLATADDSDHPGRAAQTPGIVGIQEQAAGTLSDLAYGDTAMQEDIIAQGAVGPLLTLIRLGSTLAQENAARTIWHLCASPSNQGVLVEAGAISELVALSKTGSVKAQELAAAVISDLAKGAILEREMREAAKEGAGTSSAAATRDELQVRMGITADKDGNHDLWLKVTASYLDTEDSSAEGEQESTSADADESPADLAIEHDGGGGDRLSAIASAGGIVPLVALVTTGAPLSKERAASALWHLSVDAVNQIAIAKASGIAPLVQLLDDGTEQATIYAAEALDRLASNNPDNQAQISKKLVALLGSRNEGAQQRSAHALWELAKSHPGAPVRIVNAGAISPLVALLGYGSIAAKEEAVGALSQLAHNDKSNQLAIATGLVALLGSGSAEGQEHVTQMLIKFAAEEKDNRMAIAEAGAIDRLVLQIKGGGFTSLKAQELAAAVLNHLSGDKDENVQKIAHAGGIKPLISLLSSESAVAQAHAAAVLADMTRHSKAIQMAVAKEGAIEPLVLLAAPRASDATEAEVESKGAAPAPAAAKQKDADRESRRDSEASASCSPVMQRRSAIVGGVGGVGGEGDGSSPRAILCPDDDVARAAQAFALSDAVWARSEAAGALWSLSLGNTDTQALIFEASAIAPLVQLLEEPSPQGQLQASGALASLAIGSKPIQDAIRECRGIPPLVELLDNASGDEVQAHACKALAEVMRGHPVNQTAVAEAEGIPPLVALLEHEEAAETAKEEAASALWSLCTGPHSANQDGIREAGGIAPLVRLIGVGSGRAQEEAAGALAAIALNHTSNRESIATKIVGLLGGESRSSGDEGGGAPASPPSPNAKGGDAPASPPSPNAHPAKSKPGRRASNTKEDMLADDTLTKAARAISSLARSHPSNQAALAAVGGILPLVSLLKGEVSRLGAQGGGRRHSSETMGGASNLPKELVGALWWIAHKNERNQTAVAEVGAVPLLIALLTSGTNDVHRVAAGALWSLSIEHGANQRRIASDGGIAPLIVLLSPQAPQLGGEVSTSARGAQETAAGALHALAALDENREKIAVAGGIHPLVALFENGTDQAKEQAAGALSTLVVDHAPNQYAVARELVAMLKNPKSNKAKQHVTHVLRDLSLDPDNRGALSKAGAIPELARQLRDSPTETGQAYAATALSQISLKSPEHRVQVTQQLVTLLGDDSDAVRQRAATALKDMAAVGGSETRMTVAMAGGIDRFVSLLEDGSAEAQEYAAAHPRVLTPLLPSWRRRRATR